MGILNLFRRKSSKNELKSIPSGSFTVDRNGDFLVSTLSQKFSPELNHELGNLVVKTFRSARNADLSLNELKIVFPGVDITAKEMRGGAIIFIKPKKFGN
ncbi:MAG TPA: hypothetical protein EYQ50_01195 [Verrucomicrobiales bacterium]|jgi:hypothetical protein|nr:hypothetical protein [Verrucomicrobiales bacterium]